MGRRISRIDNYKDLYDRGECQWCGAPKARAEFKEVHEVLDKDKRVVLSANRDRRFCNDKCMRCFYTEP